MTTVVVAHRLEELEPHLAAWDRLAEEERRPLARPAWWLAWWRAHGPERRLDGGLRVILVRDGVGDRLVGVAPLFISTRVGVVQTRFLGGVHLPWVGRPLVRSDGAKHTMSAIVRSIAGLRPRTNIFYMDEVEGGSSWARTVVGEWPGRHRPWLREASSARGFAVRLDGTFDDWMRARGGSWRANHLRRLRQWAERGGAVRRAATADEGSRGLTELIRLHRARWSVQGGNPITPALERTLRDAHERLRARDGFRLWMAELDGRIIGVSAFAAAGGEADYLFTAFDPAWRRFAPGQLSVVAGIEEGFRLGEIRLDLRWGEYPYKIKLANEVRRTVWYQAFPRDRAYPRVRATKHAHEAVVRAGGRVAAGIRRVDIRDRDQDRDTTMGPATR